MSTETAVNEPQGATHTQGPWTLDRPTPSERWVLGREQGTGRLVLVAACETDADACLIAAAPELLAACKAAMADLQWPQTKSMLCAAIAKAEGGAS